jgi:hypothetical protein
MKRILLLLGLGLIVINVTNGCNKSPDTTSTTATDTNSVATNSAAPAGH